MISVFDGRKSDGGFRPQGQPLGSVSNPAGYSSLPGSLTGNDVRCSSSQFPFPHPEHRREGKVMGISRSQGQLRVPVSHPASSLPLTGSRTGDDPWFRVLQCPFSHPEHRRDKKSMGFPLSGAASGSGLTSIQPPVPYRFPNRR